MSSHCPWMFLGFDWIVLGLSLYCRCGYIGEYPPPPRGCAIRLGLSERRKFIENK